MSTGTVKWFNNSRGFGFITPDDGSADLFAHFSEISANNGESFRTLQDSQRVSFNVVQGPKGPHASDIKLA
ncbi:Cold shock-like protein CspA [Pandoraea horticolens]|uniref:Cold shock-like protein CspA n=1 Tax=Pandoraea horticolens TaxID=2508298 RepID=A0A5E4WB45_9BURK|nr:cold-shock protein [Pandoraea horticolens]VVE21621.1 Cold shock-like protein CspA [Pandoraea horticolens]